MPLPAYLLQQPELTPAEALSRRMSSLGVTASVTRRGSTLFLRNLDADDLSAATRSLRMVAEFADANRLVVDAHVPSVLGHLSQAYLDNGFLVGHETDEEDEEGAHHVMRRKPRL